MVSEVANHGTREAYRTFTNGRERCLKLAKVKTKMGAIRQS